MAYSAVEPFGAETQYYGPAITTAMLANVNRAKGTQPVKPDAFIPKFEHEEQAPASMILVAQMMTAGLGGNDLREDE